MFLPPRKLHPYCRSERDTANKHTAHHRAICSLQAALGIFNSLFAPNHGPLLSAPFAYFSCILLCASVAAGSRPRSGALVRMQKAYQNVERQAVVDATYSYIEQRLQACKTNKQQTGKKIKIKHCFGPPLQGRVWDSDPRSPSVYELAWPKTRVHSSGGFSKIMNYYDL